MSYFARLAQRSAMSPDRPAAPQPAAPVGLERDVETVAPPPASQAQTSARPESAASAQILEPAPSEATASEPMARTVERLPQPATAPPEPKVMQDHLLAPGIESPPPRSASPADAIESFTTEISSASANVRLPQPDQQRRVAAAANADARPPRGEPDTTINVDRPSEAPAASPRTFGTERAGKIARPERIVRLLEDEEELDAPPQRRDNPERPQASRIDEARTGLRRPTPPRSRPDQTSPRDTAAKPAERPVEIHIGRISLQVSTPQPAAPAPVPPRESFAPHRHYLRWR